MTLSEDPELVDLVIEALGDVQGSADRIVASTVLWALEPHLERREVMARPGTGEDGVRPRSPVGTPLAELLDIAESMTDEGMCPYYRRGEEGQDPKGICDRGCETEPACQTCWEAPGWPSERLCAWIAAADLLPREALRQVGWEFPEFAIRGMDADPRMLDLPWLIPPRPVYVIDPEEGTQ